MRHAFSRQNILCFQFAYRISSTVVASFQTFLPLPRNENDMDQGGDPFHRPQLAQPGDHRHRHHHLYVRGLLPQSGCPNPSVLLESSHILDISIEFGNFGNKNVSRQHEQTFLTIRVFYSYCAKTPVSLVKAMEEQVIAKIYLVFTVLCRHWHCHCWKCENQLSNIGH